ncbi:MAG: hypothetical protein IT379_21085 [Deltaproteobacteria bacterium]|nr:hypothetical protein [Deltaproteobacteria bacterium]
MGRKHPLRVVVLSSRDEPEYREVAGIVGEALAEPPLRDPDAAVEDRTSRPSFEPMEAADALVEEADAVVALDAEALDRAREHGNALCVAMLPWLDGVWGGDLRDADLVLVAHRAVVDDLEARGVAPERVVVVGAPLPPAYAPPTDRALARGRAGIPEGHAVLVAPTDALESEDLGKVLTQLSLVRTPLMVLFDVGDDALASDTLRKLAPACGVPSRMFGAGPQRGEYFALADAVIARVRAPEAVRGLAVGAPLLLIDAARRTGPSVARALMDAGAASAIESIATLAVDVERAITPDRLAAGQAAAVAASIRAQPSVIFEAIRLAVMARTRRRRRRGLPLGLESLYEPGEERLDLSQSGSTRPPPKTPGETDEERVERELAALKSRLGKA